MRKKYYGRTYEKKYNHRETEDLTRQMKKASDIEVCEKIIMLAREVIEENGNHDIRLYARDSRGKMLK